MNTATRHPDVTVIGAGIIGLSTALELARAGLRVCVLDKGEIGREASWAGGGILSALPPGNIATELQPLLEESLRLYPSYCAQLYESTGIDPEYWRCGLRYSDSGRVHWFPGIAQVRNPRLIKALQSNLERLGVTLRPHTAAVGFETQNGRLIAIRLAGGLIPCGKAVIAAGAWSGQLMPMEMKPAKGEMLLLRGQPGLLAHILMNGEVYLIPRRDGRILVGSTVEDAGFDATPTARARVWLMQQAAGLMPETRQLEIENHWAGLRPRPAGDLPWIGAAAGVRDLYLNTGHFRLGITLAPASAVRMKTLILKD